MDPLSNSDPEYPAVTTDERIEALEAQLAGIAEMLGRLTSNSSPSVAEESNGHQSPAPKDEPDAIPEDLPLCVTASSVLAFPERPKLSRQLKSLDAGDAQSFLSDYDVFVDSNPLAESIAASITPVLAQARLDTRYSRLVEMHAAWARRAALPVASSADMERLSLLAVADRATFVDVMRAAAPSVPASVVRPNVLNAVNAAWRTSKGSDIQVLGGVLVALGDALAWHDPKSLLDDAARTKLFVDSVKQTAPSLIQAVVTRCREVKRYSTYTALAEDAVAELVRHQEAALVFGTYGAAAPASRASQANGRAGQGAGSQAQTSSASTTVTTTSNAVTQHNQRQQNGAAAGSSGGGGRGRGGQRAGNQRGGGRPREDSDAHGATHDAWTTPPPAKPPHPGMTWCKHHKRWGSHAPKDCRLAQTPASPGVSANTMAPNVPRYGRGQGAQVQLRANPPQVQQFQVGAVAPQQAPQAAPAPPMLAQPHPQPMPLQAAWNTMTQPHQGPVIAQHQGPATAQYQGSAAPKAAAPLGYQPGLFAVNILGAVAGRSPLDNEPLLVPARLNGVETVVELDTGAAVTCMSQATFNDIQAGGPLPRSDSEAPTVTTATGEPIDGPVVDVPVVMPGANTTVTLTWPIQVMPGDAPRVLIGRGLLRELGLLSDAGLLLPSDEVPDDDDDTTPLGFLDDRDDPVASSEVDKVTIPDSPIAGDLRRLVAEFADLFEAELPREGSTLEPFTIELVRPFTLRARPRSLAGDLALQVPEDLAALERAGIIRHSQSPVASPHVIATKKDGDRRFCVAYNELNDCTMPDAYPLPDIREFVHAAAGCTYFAALDLRSGYHQMMMSPEAVPLTSFVIPGAQFEYTRVPFGLMNAPGRFQRAMDFVLAGVTGLRVYVDDVFLFARDPETFLQLVREVFQRLRTARLRLKAKKCELGCAEVEVVGFRINANGRSVAPARKEAMLSLPPPEDIHDLRRVLGKFNYLADFVPGMSHLTAPLNDLSKAGAPWQWTTVHQAAYEALKERAVAETTLALPDTSCEWLLETDASNVACGGVLWQLDADGSRAPISYFGKKFSDVQTRWPTVEQELYAIIHAVTRPDLAHLFKLKPFTIATDHRNLCWLVRRAEEGGRKLTRWRLILAEYSFTIRHVAGRDNKVADSLSRPPGVHAIQPQGNAFITRLREAQATCPDAQAGTRSVDGLYRTPDNLVIIPEPLRADVFVDAHRLHLGRDATTRNVRAMGFTWPGLTDYIAAAVRRCGPCLKTRLATFRESAIASTMVTTPFQTVALDSVGPFPTDTSGNRYLLVCIDVFTRFIELIPLPNHTAAAAAFGIWTHVFARHGLPAEIRTDNGGEFINRVLSKLAERLNVTHHRTLPYHPQSNGIVERANAEIGRHLRLLACLFDQHDNWSTLAPYVAHVMNNTVHSATSFTPHELLYGSEGPKPFSLAVPPVDDEPSPEPLATIDEYHGALNDLLSAYRKEAEERQSRIVNTRTPPAAPALEPGQFVLKHNERRSKMHGALGPFKVLEILPNKAVRIQTILGDDTPHVVHADKLFLFDADAPLSEMRQFAAYDREEFIPRAFHGFNDDRTEVLVEWDGFDRAHDTWEPTSSLAGNPRFVAYQASA